MLTRKFPLYAIRAYESIDLEGDWTIISTFHSKFVLDNKSLEGNYWQRRVRMLDIELPYKLYPMREKFSTVSQVVNSKRRLFVDSEGKLFKYKPTVFYKIQYEKVRLSWTTDSGKTAFIGFKCPDTFIVDSNEFTHFGYIKVGLRYVLYELTNEKKKDARKKL